MSGDRGAKALAERLDEPHVFDAPLGPEAADELAAAILLEHGLFVEDVRDHEPFAFYDGMSSLSCRCGWRNNVSVRESYFDHIGTQP